VADYRDLACRDEARRARVREAAGLDGIDYIEVPATSLDEQRFLHVHFLSGEVPPGLVGRPDLFSIEGGTRIRDLRVVAVSDAGDHLVVEANAAGDFSPYTLAIDLVAVGAPDPDDPPRLDPPFARCAFRFKAGCPRRFDCGPDTGADESHGEIPPIDYLAKDFASFRQALLDLAPTLVPDWTERHAADLGMALVELMAYVGDHLSYYQDAIANEAYLDTARQRISVRRHAALIDYRMHDGVSARTFVHFALVAGQVGVLPKDTQVLTRIHRPLGNQGVPREGQRIHPDCVGEALQAARAVFETIEDAPLHWSLNEIRIHSWGNRQCCVGRGSTTLDLVDEHGTLGDALGPGSYLLLEEVKSPETAKREDADRAHRQVVRLTRVEATVDPIDGQRLLRVVWDEADALRFPLCLGARRPDGTFVVDVSVARGNLVLADHGRRLAVEMHASPRAPVGGGRRLAHEVLLHEGPLGFRAPLPEHGSPASRALVLDPAAAQPMVVRLDVARSNVAPWEPRRHLLDSNAFDAHFAVETDNEGRARLRFGFGGFGLPPPDGEGDGIGVTYRVGVGRAGNVGAESLRHVVSDAPVAQVVTDIRNPLPVENGVDPESIEEVRRAAPASLRRGIRRAVTEEDYARVAELHPAVDRAVARFRWTGSWRTVFLRIDVRGRADVPAALCEEVRDWVMRFALTGYDVEVLPPSFVPLEIEIEVCAGPGHFRADVERATYDALERFFLPDNFSFGDPLFLSRLYRAVGQVSGVSSAVVTRFKRLWEAAGEANLAAGLIPIDRLEVLRLDNDPSFPEHGTLILQMRGGK